MRDWFFLYFVLSHHTHAHNKRVPSEGENGMAEQFLDGDLVIFGGGGSSGLHLSVATEVFFSEVIAFFIAVGAVTMAWVLTPVHAIGHGDFAGRSTETERGEIFFSFSFFFFLQVVLWSCFGGFLGIYCVLVIVDVVVFVEKLKFLQVLRSSLLLIQTAFFIMSLVFATSYYHNFAIVTSVLMMWCSTLASLAFCIRRRLKGPPWDVSRVWFVVFSVIGAIIPWAVGLSIHDNGSILPFVYAWIPVAALLVLRSAWFCAFLFTEEGASKYNAGEHRKALVDVYTSCAVLIAKACQKACCSANLSLSSSDTEGVTHKPFMTGDTDVLEL